MPGAEFHTAYLPSLIEAVEANIIVPQEPCVICVDFLQFAAANGEVRPRVVVDVGFRNEERMASHTAREILVKCDAVVNSAGRQLPVEADVRRNVPIRIQPQSVSLANILKTRGCGRCATNGSIEPETKITTEPEAGQRRLSGLGRRRRRRGFCLGCRRIRCRLHLRGSVHSQGAFDSCKLRL